MKILSTEGLTKLIQLIKSSFISTDNTVTTNTIELADVATSGIISDLSDVEITNVQNQQILSYNSTTQKWENTTGGGGSITVDQTFNGSSTNAQSGVAIQGELEENYAHLYGDVEFSSVNTQMIMLGNELTYITGETDSETGAINLIINGSNISLGANNSIDFSGTNFRFNNNELATQTWVNNQGYTSNTGTVTSVNNVQPVNGNVTLSIPTATSDLTNDSGFITSSDLPTNYVTTDTTQDITGTKTFVGQKKIAFKQSGTSDKLGFTLYNNSGTEKGYLEYNPSNNVDGVPLMTLGNYATASGGLTHVGFRKYSSISGANGAYNLLTPLISDAKTPFNLTTTYTNFYLPLGFTDGNTTIKTAKSGMVDLSSIIPTATSDLTNDSGFITSIPTATSSTLGIVQPDNTTITIDSNGVISSNGASGRNVGEVITSTLPLTDAGLHLLDGTLLQYGIYKEFIDYIADLYAENPSANYFTTESAWQASVTQYGSCGKFVYDSTNKTVRLPKISDILQSTTDVTALGDLIVAGLPNIKNEFNGGRIFTTNDYNGGVVAPFIKSPTPAYLPANSGKGNQTSIIGFDASLLSTIYGNSTTVQPQTIKAFVYIVVANSSKTDIQVDIDEIATDLNNKAGTDLANVTNTGKVLMSGMGLPSNKALTFTVGASGSNMTIPANGWLAFRGKASAANQFVSLKISGNSVYREEERQVPYVNGWVTILIPVNAGDTVTYYYNIKASDIYQFQLIYAQGSKN